MNILNKAFDALERFVFERASDRSVLIEAASRRDYGTTALSDLTQKRATSPREQTLADWKRSTMAATDPDNPDWTLLFDLHENLMLDDHLESVIESRTLYTRRHAFKFVDTKGEESKEILSLFKKPWMDELMSLALYNTYRGRKLIELFELNSDGELDTVTEIEQPYFNTKLGIVTKNPGEQQGWNYREGIYSNYYVQVGKDNNLGMLSRMAPILLAKKLGMGSWLDWIDKYGIPPLFITTDREDDNRLKQLWNAAMKFKSNNFMVGRGQEKFEVGQVGGAGVAPFDQLCTRADNMISKRILGGTGLTDEKGFVGSVEIQYKLAKDRFELDKLFFNYFFNTRVKPRLIKLSPVYAPLAGFTFEWDNTVNLTQTEIIDNIVKLGSNFDIDPEYVERVTGIPIIGIKTNQTLSPEVDPSKK